MSKRRVTPLCIPGRCSIHTRGRCCLTAESVSSGFAVVLLTSSDWNQLGLRVGITRECGNRTGYSRRDPRARVRHADYRPIATRNATKAAQEAGFRQLDTAERYRTEKEAGEAMREVFKAIAFHFVSGVRREAQCI